MAQKTPDILKKIVARKHEEISESANSPVNIRVTLLQQDLEEDKKNR